MTNAKRMPKSKCPKRTLPRLTHAPAVRESQRFPSRRRSGPKPALHFKPGREIYLAGTSALQIRACKFQARFADQHSCGLKSALQSNNLRMHGQRTQLQLRACATPCFYATSPVSDADNQWTDQKIRRADVVRRCVAAGKPPGPHRPR